MLNWHRSWYRQDGPEKHLDVLYPGPNGDWHLTVEERRRILLSNIYGVDIDPQAVEVTKLSLLLKVLEGESEQTLSRQYKLFHKHRVLPDLGSNIKCGNSLIGPDIYQNRILSDEQMQVINAFDWRTEFASVMKPGGFDAVIGNPPYLFITELDVLEKEYFAEVYATCEYRFDVYGLFMELAVTCLLRTGGLVSFIIPHTLLSNDSFGKLRRLLLTKTQLEQVVDIGPGVFVNAKNETMIFLARKLDRPKQRATGKCRVCLTSAREFSSPFREFEIDPRDWLNNPHAAWLVRVSSDESAVISKMESAGEPLGSLCTINQGLRTGNNEKYIGSALKSSVWKPAAGGKEVSRYDPLRDGLYVYYKPEILDAPRRREIFDSPEKLVVQEIRNIVDPRFQAMQ